MKSPTSFNVQRYLSFFVFVFMIYVIHIQEQSFGLDEVPIILQGLEYVLFLLTPGL